MAGPDSGPARGMPEPTQVYAVFTPNSMSSSRSRESLARRTGGGGEGAGREKFAVTTLAFEGVNVPARLFSVHCAWVFAVLEVVVEVHVEHLRRRGGREGQKKGFDENGREKSRRLFFEICFSQDFGRIRKGKRGVGRPSDPSGLRKLSCGVEVRTAGDLQRP